MNEITQNNIKDSDLAYDIKLRIDFIEPITESDLVSVDSLISSRLMGLGIGFASAQGVDFISASLLDFGETPKFYEVRKCLNEVLATYQSVIKQISYSKSEFTQAHFDFIAEKIVGLETVANEIKFVFSEVDFTPIGTSSDSPEHKFFSGSDPEETITLFISEINYNQKDWIKFSIGCKRLTDNEIDALLKRVNKVQPNSFRIKWNGLDYNYDTEVWELPKHHKLFELI
jgi:hypothetical protein